MQEIDLPPLAPSIHEISDLPTDPESKSVLILEDDVVFADTLKDALESIGYRLTIVPSGVEGIQKILASDFDAIVCDMVMPNFPGDMFYLAVGRTRPHLCKRFIFISGHKDNPKITQFVKQSGRMVLWKPFELHRLLMAIGFVTRWSDQLNDGHSRRLATAARQG